MLFLPNAIYHLDENQQEKWSVQDIQEIHNVAQQAAHQRRSSGRCAEIRGC
jgi:hypothetical protein